MTNQPPQQTAGVGRLFTADACGMGYGLPWPLGCRPSPCLPWRLKPGAAVVLLGQTRCFPFK